MKFELLHLVITIAFLFVLLEENKMLLCDLLKVQNNIIPFF